MKENNKRVIFFDYLRLAAFFMVFFVHIFQRYRLPIGAAFGIPDFYWVSMGGVAVSLFIVLSGLTLTYAYENRKFAWLDFLQRRLLRIYVPYFIVVTLALMFLGVQGRGVGEYFLNYSGFLVFTGALWSSYFVSTGWFVGLIVVLYLIYPFFKKLFDNYNINHVLFFLLLIEIISRYFVGKYMPGQRPLDWFPLCRAFEFGLGIWLIKSSFSNKLMDRFHGIKLINTPVVYLSSISFHMYLVQTEVIKRLPLANNLLVFSVRAFLITLMISIFVLKIERLLLQTIFTLFKYYRKSSNLEIVLEKRL